MRPATKSQEQTGLPGHGEGPLTLGVFAVSVLLLFARAPFAVSKFWAEDGTVFLQDAMDRGVASAFLEDYAGYYHLVPRVAGAFAAIVPIDWAPHVTWLVVAAMIGWCAATVFVSSRTWVTALSARLLLAAGIVLLPIVGTESVGNVSNLHFIMLFPGALVVISRPSSRPEVVNGGLFLVVATLTTLQTAVLLPLVAVRILVRRPWRLDAISVAWIVGSVVHFAAIVITRPERAVSTTSSIPSVLFNYVKRVVFENFSPTDRAAGLIGTVLLLLAVVFIGKAIMVSWPTDRERALLLGAVPLVGLLLWSFLGWRLGGTTPRYAIFPAMCLAWAILVASEVLFESIGSDGFLRRWGATVAAGLMLVAWLPHWIPSDLRTSGPRWSTSLSVAEEQCVQQGGGVVVVQVPPGALEGDPWPVRLPCADIP